ncbi:MAG TPA: ABC-2 family transporter protein [Kineosporiaceae bacterium]
MAELAASLRAYRTLLGARLHSQLVYRASFGLDLVGSVAVAVTDFTEVYVIFHNVPTLGGLDVGGAFLVFGLATLGFALANACCGELDTMPQFIRTGALEIMLLRPMPLLAQIITGDVRLKRIGGAVVGGAVLATGLVLAHVTWTPQRVALVVLSPLSGALVFSALFVVAGAVQFWLVDAADVTNAFTYGGAYASRYSSGAMPLPIRLLFAFIIPTAFTAYLPALAVLGLPGPPWLPAWLGWCAPAVGVLAWLAALVIWRVGVRHYTGAGG